ncbi:hypothetical protein AwDysgo_04700 [Bacteroidales bacterium]|nr:hypothetical protein AwDysgo_04700 [Bacteroidales bacterium]
MAKTARAEIDKTASLKDLLSENFNIMIIFSLFTNTNKRNFPNRQKNLAYLANIQIIYVSLAK